MFAAEVPKEKMLALALESVPLPIVDAAAALDTAVEPELVAGGALNENPDNTVPQAGAMGVILRGAATWSERVDASSDDDLAGAAPKLKGGNFGAVAAPAVT